MHPICGFLLIAQAAQGISAEAIPVQHMRPSKLMALLNQMQPSTVLTADDEKGLLYVRAGKDTVAEYKSYANLFDVKSRRVRVSLEVNSEIDQQTTNFESVIANNKKFTMTDAEMGIEVKVAARINDDNTVTLYVEQTYQKKTTSVVVRTKNLEPFLLALSPDGTVAYSNKVPADPQQMLVFDNAKPGLLRKQDANGVQRGDVRKWPTLRFQVAIQDEPAPTAK